MKFVLLGLFFFVHFNLQRCICSQGCQRWSLRKLFCIIDSSCGQPYRELSEQNRAFFLAVKIVSWNHLNSHFILQLSVEVITGMATVDLSEDCFQGLAVRVINHIELSEQNSGEI